MRRMWIYLMCMAIALSVIYGCGHAEHGTPTGPSGGGSGGGTSPGELVKLVSRKLEPDQRWTYVIGLRAAGITGIKTAPFMMGSFNRWQVQPISDADGDGFYEVTITSFNREVRLSYGGGYSAGSWADLKWSSFYSQSDLSLVIGLYEGVLYVKNTAPFSPVPGKMGDAFLRFSLDYSQATVYFNLNQMYGDVNHPFYMGSFNDWLAPISMTVDNADGYGHMTFSSVAYPMDVSLAYGGDHAANLWVNPNGSAYYDSVHDNLHFCLKSNPTFTVAPGACP